MKKRCTNKVLQENAKQQRIADAIVKKVITIQSRSALFMQRRTERLPKRFKKGVFVFLFLSGACYSSYLIVSGFTGKREPAIHIQSIHLPTLSVIEIKSRPLITETELKKIDAFKLYVDSLQKTVSGKQTADSILAARPGLMDSIQQLELIYHSLKK